MKGGARCGCGARERAATLRRGRDVLDVIDLSDTPATMRPWIGPGPESVEPRVWAVNYLIDRGWVAHEVVHLLLEHGRWRDLGPEGAPARVRSFVRDVAIGAVPLPTKGNVMRRRGRTVRDVLDDYAKKGKGE